jgi:hypothetical protein
MDPQDIDLILVLAAGARGCVGPLVGRKDARAREVPCYLRGSPAGKNTDPLRSSSPRSGFLIHHLATASSVCGRPRRRISLRSSEVSMTPM